MDFTLYWYNYIQILVVIGGIFTIPGWAILVTTDYWKKWTTLQRWILAIGLSIAFYPVLFYSARILFPRLQIGPNKNYVILILGLVWIIYRLRGALRNQVNFNQIEWIAILIFIGTLFTRYYIAYTNPFPAWSDSLHHTLLTEIVGASGRLPKTLEPYAPTSLDMYHLGLYALTGTVQQLANVPAHTALLWTAQTLNGLCGLGIYLVLDRKVSNIGAIAGATLVGLIFHMPAWYVNWGRFTQIASQTILLIAWIVTWDAITYYQEKKSMKFTNIWPTFLAGVITASIFFFHFRVAGFYIPLLIITILAELLNIYNEKILIKCTIIPSLILCIIVLILIMSPFIDAFEVYYLKSKAKSLIPTSLRTSSYHQFSLESIPVLVAKPWLLFVTCLGTIINVIWKNRIFKIFFVWTLILIVFGNLFRLNIPLLSFSNIGAILIMLYIPMGITLGIFWDTLEKLLFQKIKKKTSSFLLGIILFGGVFGGILQINNLESYRFFVTNADINAMDWIKRNTPQNSTFVINTFLWLKRIPHGTDGGYWIPYFTDRKTTNSTMLVGLDKDDYYHEVIQLASLSAQLSNNAESLKNFCDMGVNYIYIGPVGNFSSYNLDADLILLNKNTMELYNNDGVRIIKICQY
jgi:hypothetical protein